MRREPVDRTPVWFMRQAGRYMPDYQAIRRKHSLLEICKNGELAAQVTMQPIELLPGLDAAILFSDILLVLEPMGLQVEFIQSEGPAIRNPVRTRADAEKLKSVVPERDLPSVLEALGIVRRELPDQTALIGFGGAPFTLASYAIEGGPSKNFLRTKSLMMEEPATWHLLMEKLTEAVRGLLEAQVKAGAQALQLFDSWAGALSPDDYREFVLPHSQRLFRELADLGVPLVHFGTGTSGILELMKEAGGDVIGVDWRIPLDEAWTRLGDVAIQGNLDPVALLGPRKPLLRRVDEVLRRAGGRPGHIFNLGHGVLPQTPVENVIAVIEHVHEQTAR